MAKYRFVGELPAFINDRLTEPGDIVELPNDAVVQTADNSDEPLFEAVEAPKKAAAKKESE
jgi:hypothetical protein